MKKRCATEGQRSGTYMGTEDPDAVSSGGHHSNQTSLEGFRISWSPACMACHSVEWRLENYELDR